MSYSYTQDDGTVATCSKLSSIPKGAQFIENPVFPDNKDHRDAWRIVDGELELDAIVKAKIDVKLDNVELTPWQMRKALNSLGLRASIESAIEATDDYDLKDGWFFATSFNKSDPLVVAMAAALNVKKPAIDKLFELGATL